MGMVVVPERKLKKVIAVVESIKTSLIDGKTPTKGLRAKEVAGGRDCT